MSSVQENENQLEKSTIGYSLSDFGAVSIDEPRAGLVGRDILLAGGNAIDAAVASYFAMSVTKPSAASLGGGGICLVRDSNSGEVETLDFRPKLANGNNNSLGIPVAIPANAFGFFALHAKFGKLKWSKLVQPAENLARFGSNVSRSFAHDLNMASPILKTNQKIWEIFSGPRTRKVLQEGEYLKQTELSTVLSLIRSKGAGSLYKGPMARQFVTAINASGANLTYEDMRDFRPSWKETIRIPFVHDTNIHFPAGTGATGITLAQVMSMVTYDQLYMESDQVERVHLIAETLERALSDRTRWSNLDQYERSVEYIVSREHVANLMESYDPQYRVVTPDAISAPLDPSSQSSSTSFAIVDASGSVVSCSLSMNSPFGIGAVAQGTGVVLGAPPIVGKSNDSFSAVLVDSKVGKRVYFAAASSGGAVAASTLINVASETMLAEKSDLGISMDMRRVHHGGADGITYVEKGIKQEILKGLANRGHSLAYVNSMGVVNAVFCKSGLPRKNRKDLDCSVKTDPRGFGLAVTLD